MVEHVVETDVLIVGGGMAGCFASIKAKEKGVDVTIVDKGYVSKTGQTPFAGSTMIFNPKWGDDLDAWMNQVFTIGEYVNNRVWTEIAFKDSYARYQDLVSYGVEFLKEGDEPDRPVHRSPHPFGAPSKAVHWKPNFPVVLRKQAVKVGVKIMDRVMVAELLKQEEKVVGAVGFSMDSLDVFIFKAKATVISAGSAGFKTLGYPISELTGDGHAMAYRAGAEIIGKEFIDTHSTRADHPGYRSSPRPFLESPRGFLRSRLRGKPGDAIAVNAEGEEVLRRGQSWPLWLELEIEAHAGRAPIKGLRGTLGRDIRVGGAAEGMSTHSADGIWPVNNNTQCASSIPGLYAAGDSLGTMGIGANYSGFGFATVFAAVTGARAGWAAAAFALQTEKSAVDEEEVARATKFVRAPLERKGGFSPRWVTQVLRNIMIPYYIMRIKHATRMTAALTLVEFLRDHLVPKMYAKTSHELRHAHETRNMVLNAEMKLKASLFRTESRGDHYREDYPRRDDPNWLAWILLKEENDNMKFWKKPIPEEWWPDLSKPYEERYPIRIPEE